MHVAALHNKDYVPSAKEIISSIICTVSCITYTVLLALNHKVLSNSLLLIFHPLRPTDVSSAATQNYKWVKIWLDETELETTPTQKLVQQAYFGWMLIFNLFTTIHDGNFRRHSSMNVTIK